MSQCTFWRRVLTDICGAAWSLPLLQSQCTFWCRVLTDYNMKEVLEWVERLSQCTFWCRVLTDRTNLLPRLLTLILSLNAPSGAGCLPTECRGVVERIDKRLSQCTFWCRVLTDCRLCKPRRSTVYSTVIATGDPCTLTHR